MGMFSRLFGNANHKQQAGEPSHVVPHGLRATLPGPGTFAIPVVGESHYQEALERICGPRSEDGEDRDIDALLVHENANPYDPMAVRVDIGGMKVGYLSREHARQYRLQIAAAGYGGVNAWCKARIRGGWDRGEDDQGLYGVWLDLPAHG